jgi:hypothetical protein
LFISVYPNPASDFLNIEYVMNEAGVLNADLLDSYGSVRSKMAPGIQEPGWHKNQMDLKGLAPGIYFLRLTAGFEVITKKIIIRH